MKINLLDRFEFQLHSKRKMTINSFDIKFEHATKKLKFYFLFSDFCFVFLGEKSSYDREDWDTKSTSSQAVKISCKLRTVTWRTRTEMCIYVFRENVCKKGTHKGSN